MRWLVDEMTLMPTGVLLVSVALATALLAIGVAWLARVFLFDRLAHPSEVRGTVADVVHGSLLAFIVFVLAHVLGDVRANLGHADDQALREASVVRRLDRELKAVGDADAQAARAMLRDYVRSAVTDEWQTLSTADPDLSPRTEEALTAFVGVTRRVIARHEDSASSIRTLLDRLEEARQGRFENSTKTVPGVFWWVISLFMLAAMAMNGRYPATWKSNFIVAMHMGAIGMVIALIVNLDEPFRGVSGISPAPLAKSVGIVVPR
ncbi:DUF4239 domain-containing protein [Pandoraea pulmonicola]|uniref:DUF4239 domain-containing protein n=1 Tax=Pandoraea pulmonicola TaxID=93221 RepID=A0AAJ5D0N5_PANPU|nr:DUF4239 domain-containing protein [Pandoraea pulmonicola]AJC20741.1 hypothetical protein RO07_10130 [Pandoraea pulmonicola]SUA90740.1 Uncharacterised protein [Pandoraea pulmonicola]